MTVRLVDRSERVAPFAAVRWREGQLEVQMYGEWRRPVAIGGIDVDELITYSRTVYAAKWLKRLAEDLPEVYFGMGDGLTSPTLVVVRDESGDAEHWLECTPENRRAALEFGRSELLRAPIRVGQDEKALRELLRTSHSYWPLVADQDWVMDPVQSCIARSSAGEELELAVAVTLGRLGDGHTRTRKSIVALLRESTLRQGLSPMYLPCRVVPVQDEGWVALDGTGVLLLESHPFLIAIDDRPISEWIEVADAVIPQGSPQLRRPSIATVLGELHWLRARLASEVSVNRVRLTLTDGHSERVVLLDAAGSPLRHAAPEEPEAKLLDDGIGYLPIVRMSTAVPLAELAFIRDSPGVIIDLRGNAGGLRELIHHLAPYFLHPDVGGIVFNLAKKRMVAGDAVEGDDLLGNRGLYSYESESHDSVARAAIAQFVATFVPEWDPPEPAFSDWRYGVLSPQAAQWHYDRPVVVLTDERCFSAGEILATALLEAPHVTHAGRPTGGGSGRPVAYTLPASGIELQISSMASFQPNGRLYEKVGIQPEHSIPLQIEEALGVRDVTLAAALDLVKTDRPPG